MNFKTLPGCLRVAVMFGLAAATHSIPYARAATSGANGTHDPSRIVESDGKFYFCSTGGNCASSVDGLKWSDAPLRIPIPAWAETYTEVTGYSGNQGIWAPDLIDANGKYYIYYSFCGKPASKAPCVIGLYTTPTLDANSTSFRLTDEGEVVNSPPNTTSYQFSTIDPAPLVDAKGELWSAWGSGYGKDASLPQIFVTRLTATGLPLTSDPGYKPSKRTPAKGFWALATTPYWPCRMETTTSRIIDSRSQVVTAPIAKCAWIASNSTPTARSNR